MGKGDGLRGEVRTFFVSLAWLPLVLAAPVALFFAFLFDYDARGAVHLSQYERIARFCLFVYPVALAWGTRVGRRGGHAKGLLIAILPLAAAFGLMQAQHYLCPAPDRCGHRDPKSPVPCQLDQGDGGDMICAEQLAKNPTPDGCQLLATHLRAQRPHFVQDCVHNLPPEGRAEFCSWWRQQAFRGELEIFACP